MVRKSTFLTAGLALAITLAGTPAQARWNGSGANWHGGWGGNPGWHGGGWNGGWHQHNSVPVWPWALGAFGLGAAGALLYSPPYYASPPPPVYGYGSYAYPSPYYAPPPPPAYGYPLPYRPYGWRPYGY